MAKVFISYRRSDSAADAGRLTDSLQRELGGRFVFRDAVSLLPGDRFEHVLEREIAAARVICVLIGPQWLEELHRRSTASETDYVRLEVAAALRGTARVVPVLVRGAPLPTRHALPDELAALAERQAIAVRDETWAHDVAALADIVGRPYRWDWLAARCGTAVALIIVGLWLLAVGTPLFADREYETWRSLALLVLGLYGAGEIASAYGRWRRLRRLWHVPGR